MTKKARIAELEKKVAHLEGQLLILQVSRPVQMYPNIVTDPTIPYPYGPIWPVITSESVQGTQQPGLFCN